MSTSEEFLKLTKDPSYYRFDLYGLITGGLNRQGWGEDITGFESACKEVAEYLESGHNIKLVYGKGCAEHDKGTLFENNDGYYLFYKVNNREQGENIERDIYDAFCNYCLYQQID